MTIVEWCAVISVVCTVFTTLITLPVILLRVCQIRHRLGR